METIKPTYVTFEQAKWLKEKGFDVPMSHYYFEDGEFKEHFLQETHGYYGDEYEVHLSEFNENWNDKWLTKKSGDRCFGCSKDRGYFETFSAPEQWRVVEWLRVKHGIWVSIFHKRHSMDKHYGYTIKHPNEIETKLWEFNSPQEAYSAAFDYVLNNLI
jgi:hypothetical protein